MRKIILGIVLATAVFLLFRFCDDRRETGKVTEASMLIQQQIKNVGKLIVTEGNFAEVFTFEDSQKKFNLDILRAEKRALVVVNAQVTLAYDLSQLQTEVDEETRTVTITFIPEPEIKINPDIEYYDVKQDYLNQFSAADYNKIKSRVTASIKKKIEASPLRENAQNRLLSELQKIYILTNSMGWTLNFEGGATRFEDEVIPIKT